MGSCPTKKPGRKHCWCGKVAVSWEVLSQERDRASKNNPEKLFFRLEARVGETRKYKQFAGKIAVGWEALTSKYHDSKNSPDKLFFRVETLKWEKPGSIQSWCGKAVYTTCWLGGSKYRNSKNNPDDIFSNSKLV